MRFAIYSRKSKFTGKGESIDNQIEMCQDYISTHFTESENQIEVYEDEGFSGKNLNRPQFQKMMSDEIKNPYDFIVVYRLDRISRNVGDFANLIDKLNQLSTSFICIKEQFDTSTPMGRAMMNIAAVFAQLERETIAERIKDNMYMLAKEGRWTGGTTPLGYKSAKKTYVEGGKEKSYFVLDFDDTQIDLIKLIFKKYLEFQSANKVQTFLNDNGYKTQKGNKWDRSNLKRLLMNPIYCIADQDSLDYFNKLGSNVCFTIDDCDGEKGILPYNRYSGQKREIQDVTKWIITVSQHKGILTGKQWIKVQEIVQQNHDIYLNINPSRRQGLNPKSILSGVLFCSCGAYMRPKIYPSGSMYYICERKMATNSKECSVSNINGDELDKAVLEELFNYGEDNSSINLQLKTLKSKINSVDSEINQVIIRLKNQQTENQRQIDNLSNAIAISIKLGSDERVIQVYNNNITALLNENKKLEKQINELSNTSVVKEDMTKNLNNITDTIQYLKQHFDDLSVQQRREFIKQIVQKVIYDGENIHIFIKGIA